jgi:hypothetical protein
MGDLPNSLESPNDRKSKLKNGEITVQEFILRNGEDTGYGRSMSQ